MATNPQQSHSTSGFALLITLLVVGVVLAVGAVLLDLTIKQVQLSSTAKDSEIAFHAANAGMECARFIRRVEGAAMNRGEDISVSCFGASDSVSSGAILNLESETDPGDGETHVTSPDNDGDAYFYPYEFDWSQGGNERCTRIDTIVASSTATGGGVEIENMRWLIPSYPESPDTKLCEAGARCTVISVRGYNQPCNQINTSYGTIEREVLLEF